MQNRQGTELLQVLNQLRRPQAQYVLGVPRALLFLRAVDTNICSQRV